MSNEQIILTIFQSLEPKSVTRLKLLDSEVRFFWRGRQFRVSDSLLVEEVQGALLASTDETHLMAELFRAKARTL